MKPTLTLRNLCPVRACATGLETAPYGDSPNVKGVSGIDEEQKPAPVGQSSRIYYVTLGVTIIRRTAGRGKHFAPQDSGNVANSYTLGRQP